MKQQNREKNLSSMNIICVCAECVLLIRPICVDIRCAACRVATVWCLHAQCGVSKTALAWQVYTLLDLSERTICARPYQCLSQNVQFYILNTYVVEANVQFAASIALYGQHDSE